MYILEDGLRESGSWGEGESCFNGKYNFSRVL